MRPDAEQSQPNHTRPLTSRWVDFIAVTFVVLLLIPLLQPAIQQPHPRRGPVCENNMKHLGLVFHEFHDVTGGFPPQFDGPTKRSWRVQLLPYIDHEVIYSKYDAAVPWDENPNWPLAKEEIKSLVCPLVLIENSNLMGAYYSSYAMPIGDGTAFGGEFSPKISDITDGLSNVVFLVEACDQKIIWTEPRDVELAHIQFAIRDEKHVPKGAPALLSSRHPAGASLLLGDGSARTINAGVDPATLQRLMLARDGVPTGDY